MKRKYINPIIRVIEDDEFLLANSDLIGGNTGQEWEDPDNIGGEKDEGKTDGEGFAETKGNGFGWEDISGW